MILSSQIGFSVFDDSFGDKVTNEWGDPFGGPPPDDFRHTIMSEANYDEIGARRAEGPDELLK